MAISVIPLLFFSKIVTNSLTNYFNNQAKKEFLAEANSWASELSKADYFHNEVTKKKIDAEIWKIGKVADNKKSYRLIILNKYGIVVCDSSDLLFSGENSEVGKTYVSKEVIEGLKGLSKPFIYDKEKILNVSVPVLSQNSKVDGVVLLVTSIGTYFDTLTDINEKVVLMTIFFVLLVAITMYAVTRSFLNILIGLSGVVEKMADGKLEQRSYVKGNNEFTDLSNAFNRMAEKIEQSEKTREEFVSNVSHELKTPLSSIKILADSILMEENVEPLQYKEFLQDITSEVDRMNFIIKDLLNIVKLDQGASGLLIEKADLDEMIKDILKRLYPIAELKNISLRYKDDKKVIAEVDIVKLTLAISNLIENGIKYTDIGGAVKVTLDSNHQDAFITVQDNGVGISSIEQLKVFTRFYRVDKTRDRETGGTGLGLSITHGTILLHNGSIKLSSKEGEGSTFVIRIPLVSD